MTIDPKGRVHSFCAAVPGAWTAMSCTLSAGLSLQWFRNNFCAEERAEAERRVVDPYDIMTEEAARSPIGSNRLIYLPYLMGRAPRRSSTSGREELSSDCPPCIPGATLSAQ